MKLFDKVRLTTDKYKEQRVSKGDIGVIVEIWRVEGLPLGFEVAFTDPKTGKDYAMFAAHEEDLEVVE